MKLIEPASECLFQTVYGFVEATNRVLPLAPIPRRWKHIDFFMEVTMQEGIVHIHLMLGLIIDNNNNKETTNSDELSNRGKGFGVINASCWV